MPETMTLLNRILQNLYDMIDVNDKFATLLKVALKGSDEALQQAYRHSLRMIAEYDLEYGPESQPRI